MSNLFAYPTNCGGHESLIYELVRRSNCKKYLELGIYDASCIKNIANIVEKAVGVDIQKKHNNTNFVFIEDTTDNFFEKNNDTFDIIFIDADHKFESVLKDFNNSLKILNKHGLILIHDTDPMKPYLCEAGYCGNSYKMIEYLKNNYPELNFINLPITEAGLTIVNRYEDQRHLQY
jgi:hypothetical protein